MPNYTDALLFSEATKKSRKAFDKDATAIMWTLKNREARPERFGNTREEIIFAPSQFSGVGSDEWNKVINNKLTEEEEWYVKRAAQLRKGIDEGKIPDPTGGADHYVNPSLASPHWADVYEKTYFSDVHNFHSETRPVKSKKKMTFDQAFSRARNNGKKTFSWNGKRYNTKLAE